VSRPFQVLKQGSNFKEEVKFLQKRLNTLGYYKAGIDGDFGPLTKAAVIKFQKNNALVVDGIVGVNTELAIMRNIWILERPILRQGAKGETVRELQYLLQKAEDISPQIGNPLKLNVGAIDGDFGPKTKAAVIKFQNDRNIAADAIVGTKTWEKLSHVVTFDVDADNFVRQNFFFSLDYVA
jgi:peptidoglycan hydrolase-like protein with peptidoglycan-binding domain